MKNTKNCFLLIVYTQFIKRNYLSLFCTDAVKKRTALYLSLGDLHRRKKEKEIFALCLQFYSRNIHATAAKISPAVLEGALLPVGSHNRASPKVALRKIAPRLHLHTVEISFVQIKRE